MTKPSAKHQPIGLDLPLDALQLTLKTTRLLKRHDVRTIRHLAAKTDSDLAAIGIAAQNRIEIREVLASRGLSLQANPV